HDSHSGTSSSSSRPASPRYRDWRGTGHGHNQFSIREQSQTEFEGYGLDAPENDLELDSAQDAYLSLQRKLRVTKQEYETRTNEQSKVVEQNQQQIEELMQDLKIKRQEISALKTIEQNKTSQIADLEKQIEKGERTSSTQKNSAATLKKQKDELEEENELMKESLREKEEALNNAILRLTAIEADSHRINSEQETVEELKERLAAEITKNEAMAFQLEFLNTEKMRLTELNGSLKSEVENLGGALPDPALDLENRSETVGMSLLAELKTATGASFGDGIDPSDVNSEASASRSPDSKWTAGHEGARRLLQESTSFNRKLKRESLRDIQKRFKENGLEKQIHSHTPYTPGTETDTFLTDDGQTSALSLKIKADDVDCELPPELQSVSEKESLLNKELGDQAELIKGLFKAVEPSHPLAVSFGGETVLGGSSSIEGRPKIDRARRRKLHTSRVLTQSETVDLLNPGYSSSPPQNATRSNQSTSQALEKRDSKKVIANVTLVSMYTIVVYLFGMITSVFLVDNAQGGGFNYARFISLDALQEVNIDMNGVPSRYKVVEIFFYWLQNLVWQGEGGYVPT
ncbi:hypothetical protein BGZ83_002993, partial [Gryganskiella cystojenkinii]